MAVIKRGKVFHLYIRPFEGKQITVKTPAQSKTEAKRIEVLLTGACRAGDYRSLEPTTREVCLRMFRNQGWEVPHGLAGEYELREALTMWKAVELFLKYPDVRQSPKRERYQQCLVHVIEKLGKDYPVKSLWIPDIKQYQLERLSDGAAPATVNREKSTLSKMLQVLVELRHLDVNPARLVKNLSERSGERQVYLSWENFRKTEENLPAWLAPIAITAYYTGMRQGEILALSRGQISLKNRMIVLAPEHVKEAQWKRVPIHLELVQVLEESMKIQALGSDLVFLNHGKRVSRFGIKKPWHRAVDC